MSYMTQSVSVNYVAPLDLESITSREIRPIYSAKAIMPENNFSYKVIGPKNNFYGLTKYNFLDSREAQSILPLAYMPVNKIDINFGYLSNVISHYEANPKAVRSKLSSLDIMSKGANSNLVHIETDFHPAEFIRPRKGGIFVSGAETIQKEIIYTFEKLMGEEFPSDIKISVLKNIEFRKICPQPGVVGVSYNRRGLGLVSEIFVLEGNLASVMLTIGHEIGHVLTKTLQNPALEEAKAYSFSFAWMEVIRENNIAGLGKSFVTSLPAANGIHDKGYFLVQKKIDFGTHPFSVYRDLVIGKGAMI